MSKTESNRNRLLEIWLPWVAGFIGALLFVRPLLAAPLTSILDRTFWYDALANIDTFAALHESFSQGPNGAGFYDWLYSGRLFHPQPRPLVTSELMPLAALATWPLAKHPVLAHNLALFVACVLNVVAGAKLARVAGARPISATIAGLAFSFCAYTNFSSARVQLLFLFPMAWCFATLLRWAQEGRTRDAVLAGVWAFVQAGLCLYYAVFLAIAVPVVALVLRLSTKRPGLLREWLVLAVSFVVAAIPAAVLLIPYRELKSELGLSRPYRHVIDQSGSIEMLAWADVRTLFGGVLPDRASWDTAYFPGAVVSLAALAGLVLWAWRSRRSAVPTLLGVAAAVGLAAARLFPYSLVVLTLIVVGLLAYSRWRQESLNAVLFAALVAIGVLLYFGPEPRSFDRSLGESPYHWMYFHVPFIDGLRVARRAAILFHVVVCVGAALMLSRIEQRRWGGIIVGALAVFVLVEGVPFNLGVQRVPETCEDQAILAARELGATVVAEVYPKRTDHEYFALSRHQATLCRVSTTIGNAGFTPPLAVVVADAVESLPDAAAHAWLWDAGVRHVILHKAGLKSQADRRRALEPITAQAKRVGSDDLIALSPPAQRSQTLMAKLDGPVVPIRGLEFEGAPANGKAFDGEERTNWQTQRPMRGDEQIVVRFDEALVSGLEWHAFGVATDLPRGLRIEREVSPGEWEPWGEWPSISPLPLGRNAVAASLAFPLEPKRAGAVRLTQLGKTKEFWLSASELIVRGQPVGLVEK